jgi:hypothetical protein
MVRQQAASVLQKSHAWLLSWSEVSFLTALSDLVF